MLVTCSIGRTSHQSLILYTVARLDTRWRDIEDGNGLPVTAALAHLQWLLGGRESAFNAVWIQYGCCNCSWLALHCQNGWGCGRRQLVTWEGMLVQCEHFGHSSETY